MTARPDETARRYEQDFENGTLRRVHDPEPLPEGSAVVVLIAVHIIGALVILARAAGIF